MSFDISPGETLGLVGESGCGKTTTGRAILRLIDATSGTVRFKNTDILSLRKKQLRTLRRHMQIIFQDPYGSLNPRLTIDGILSEPLKIHGDKTKDRVADLLNTVGLSPDVARRYPHEFSGGQRQRIGIARALAVKPQFIIADEPVSALDVSIQAQIVNLLQDLQAQFGLAYLFIAHDLSVIKHISNRVAVMYLGKIVELAESQELYDNPQHPYTRALLSSIPHTRSARQGIAHHFNRRRTQPGQRTFGLRISSALSRSNTGLRPPQTRTLRHRTRPQRGLYLAAQLETNRRIDESRPTTQSCYELRRRFVDS